MSQSRWRETKNWSALFDLLACLAGFGAAVVCEGLWFGPGTWRRPGSWELPWLLSSTVGWLVVVFPERQWHEGVRLWVDGFLAIMGTNLLVQCGLTYLFAIPPASWPVIIIGSVLSIGLTGLGRAWSPGVGGRRGTILMGLDPINSSLATVLQARVMDEPAALDQACETQKPGSIVFSGKPGASLFRKLLELHYTGIEVEGAPAVYERVFQRVAWESLPPSELLFFLNPNTSPAMQAFQAAYKNLLGLALRVIFAPLLILTSLLIVIFTGGPALEHIECLGFRRIPFQMLRFRIYRSDGSPSRIGNIISKLHLTNLPQLMNVVRGEMTLFGPAPVRAVFATRLCQLLPAYAYRFTVKPGIFGWRPEGSVEETPGMTDEARLLELDLYYVKQESPSLDLDILVRMLRRRSAARPEPAAVADIARN